MDNFEYSYENYISYDIEGGGDDCSTCPYKGNECRSQCMEVETHYNPNIERYYSAKQG